MKHILRNKFICQKCGLPFRYCVCQEIEREVIRKKMLRQNDDFIYCNTCGLFHYRGCHRKMKI